MSLQPSVEIVANESHAADPTGSPARRTSNELPFSQDWREARDAVPQLEVLNVPFDGQSAIRVLDLSDTTQLDISQLSQVLSSLQPPAKAMVRLFVSTYPSDITEQAKNSKIRIALQRYFNLIYDLRDSTFVELRGGNDVRTIKSQ